MTKRRPVRDRSTCKKYMSQRNRISRRSHAVNILIHAGRAGAEGLLCRTVIDIEITPLGQQSLRGSHPPKFLSCFECSRSPYTLILEWYRITRINATILYSVIVVKKGPTFPPSHSALSARLSLLKGGGTRSCSSRSLGSRSIHYFYSCRAVERQGNFTCPGKNVCAHF